MAKQNSIHHYGSVAKTFHWLTALLMLAIFPLGYFATQLAHQITASDFSGDQSVIARAVLMFSLHKTLGLALFATALLRILWAMGQTKPASLHPERKAEVLAAEVVHWLLYGSLVLAPLSGWIHHAATTGYAPIWWPFGQDLPFVPKSVTVADAFGGLHWLFVWTLAGSLGLHIAGALKHHVIDRDITLLRMLPGRAAAAAMASGGHAQGTGSAQDNGHGPAPALIAVAIWTLVLAGGGAFGVYSKQQGITGAPVASDTASTDAAETGAADTSATTSAAEGAADDTGNWSVAEGTLGLSIVQMGSAVEGSFEQWAATIQFDEPAAPGPAGRVRVEIAIASLSLGTVTNQAMGADYFDSATYPTAVFDADITKLAAGQPTGYIAEGTLRIRDQEVPLSLPFDLQLSGDSAEMSGTVEVNRLDFNIGQGVQDEGSLAYAVQISVDLTATRTE
ncbi:cytochrome b/b6 domain-containing protein [Phaeobacter sp.]|uniref:cytochrome b/b6 domain-containing protein n=1 Tax=Phaeobacter sp. TaxID=1902409 RepID=UPI0025D76AAC|nr:cytochrome b/b6 domain-containing protein [Phaeobacter sp.]